MNVKTKDMDRKIHETKVAFNMVGIQIDYPMTELVLETLERIKKRKSFTLDEATEMQWKHKEKWEKYDALNNK